MTSRARYLSLLTVLFATLACAPDAGDLPDEPERRAVVAESRPVVAESNVSGQTQPAAPDAAVFTEFTDRVQQYVKLRKMLEENLPELKKTTDTAEINAASEGAGRARPGRAQGREAGRYLHAGGGQAVSAHHQRGPEQAQRRGRRSGG